MGRRGGSRSDAGGLRRGGWRRGRTGERRDRHWKRTGILGYGSVGRRAQRDRQVRGGGTRLAPGLRHLGEVGERGVRGHRDRRPPLRRRDRLLRRRVRRRHGCQPRPEAHRRRRRRLPTRPVLERSHHRRQRHRRGQQRHHGGRKRDLRHHVRTRLPEPLSRIHHRRRLHQVRHRGSGGPGCANRGDRVRGHVLPDRGRQRGSETPGSRRHRGSIGGDIPQGHPGCFGDHDQVSRPRPRHIRGWRPLQRRGAVRQRSQGTRVRAWRDAHHSGTFQSQAGRRVRRGRGGRPRPHPVGTRDGLRGSLFRYRVGLRGLLREPLGRTARLPGGQRHRLGARAAHRDRGRRNHRHRCGSRRPPLAGSRHVLRPHLVRPAWCQHRQADGHCAGTGRPDPRRGAGRCGCLRSALPAGRDPKRAGQPRPRNGWRRW